jgi:hypothetical protein
MKTKGSGSLQALILKQLIATEKRYTPSALHKVVGKSSVGSICNGLNGLQEAGLIVADGWRTGYCYRAKSAPANSPVVEVRMVAKIVETTP